MAMGCGTEADPRLEGTSTLPGPYLGFPFRHGKPFGQMQQYPPSAWLFLLHSVQSTFDVLVARSETPREMPRELHVLNVTADDLKT
jgi:hypothetical protein